MLAWTTAASRNNIGEIIEADGLGLVLGLGLGLGLGLALGLGFGDGWKARLADNV